MSTSKVPKISITADSHRTADSHCTESDSDGNSSNDMDYNQNLASLTDVEDLDSYADAERPYSRKSSRNNLNISNGSISNQGDVTDIEDYDDSEADEADNQSVVLSDLKLSLHEFLRHDCQEHYSINNGNKEIIGHKTGNFLLAQNLNSLNDYLTDCEDFNTDSEIENNCETSACVDLKGMFAEQINIADLTKKTKDFENSECDNDDISIASDLSCAASALSDVTGKKLQGMSEDEIMELTSNEEIYQLSGSESDLVSIISEEDLLSGASLPPIDITFIHPTKIPSIKNDPFIQNVSSKGNLSNKMFIAVETKNEEEVLTDIEHFDDSVAESIDKDSFDGDDDNQQPIPQAIIMDIGDEGGYITDCEDLFFDDASEAVAPGLEWEFSVDINAIPQPQREVIMLQEDKFGDTITNVMPMAKEYQFGIYANKSDECVTDTEEYSCSDDGDMQLLSANYPLRSPSPQNLLVERDVTVANELLKTQQSKRSEILLNAESVTDVEEIYVAGTSSRKKKLKSRALTKSKSKFLETPKSHTIGDAGTDIKDMDLTDNVLLTPYRGTKKIAISPQPNQSHSEKVKDMEDNTADAISSVSVAELIFDINNSNLKEYETCNKNIVVSLETCASAVATEHKKKYTSEFLGENNLISDQNLQQQQTDVEDVQLPSDAEDCMNIRIPKVNCVCQELTDMLSESCTTVHEKCINSFNIDAEKLYIKETLQIYVPEPQNILSVETIAAQGTKKHKIECEKNVKDGHDDDNDKDVEIDGREGNDEEEDEDYDYENEYDKSAIDTDSDLAKLLPTNIENVRNEAIVLVDNVLEESIQIVNEQHYRDPIETSNVVANTTKGDYNSESENYAITCDDVDGLDVIKSPTIESMSGKSFDDNLSFTDEHIATVVTVVTTFSQNQLSPLPTSLSQEIKN